MGWGTSRLCLNCGKYELLIHIGIGWMYAPELFTNPPSIKPNNWNFVKYKRIINKVEDLMINKKS